jgi:hypothetical protein
MMRTLLDQWTPQSDSHLGVRTADEERELALLAQFMRHDSVVSLAKALAERKGVRTGDLIAAAGLDLSRTDS